LSTPIASKVNKKRNQRALMRKKKLELQPWLLKDKSFAIKLPIS